MRIKQLDQLTIQKIAAGEVIERPSSIVKELVENSIDANGREITIEILKGGKSYIRVTDNGFGIKEEDLEIAFLRHTTSKLLHIEDLYRIKSMGFRGEALASISAVAKVEVLTKSKDRDFGINAYIEDSKIVKRKPIGMNNGTTMIIRDLFCSLPVRKSFLKSDLAESNHITDLVYRMALGNPGISFKYIKDNKVIFQTMTSDDLNTNIYRLMGKEFANNLINIYYKSNNITIKGYISNNLYYRGNRSNQYLYINNRYIHNNHITNIIEDEYKGIIPNNRFPVIILFIDIDPSLIDVNVHPTKQEIKFINQEEVDFIVSDLIKQSLDKSIQLVKGFNKIEEKRDGIEKDLPLLYDKEYSSESFDGNIEEKRQVDTKNNVKEETIDYKVINTFKALENSEYIGSIFLTYIIFEDRINERIILIDQHAAHERIMYERYKKDFYNEKVIIQNLIEPEVISLPNHERELLLDNIELFISLGYDLEDFGGGNIILRGVPILFGLPQNKNLFLETLDIINNNIKSNYQMAIDKIIKISCTNAIKAGDKLKDIEIHELLKQLKKTDTPLSCPHGRPTIIEILKKDFEKEFKRIQG